MYPENMVDNWQEDIDDILQLPYAYCVHDQDKDGNEEDRKKHIHLIIAFPNTTTYNHAMSVFKELEAKGHQAVNEIKRVISMRQAYNYLIHDTDNCREKGKHQYGKDERIEGNNFDIGAYEQIGIEEKLKMRVELSIDLLEKRFTTYALFYDYVLRAYKGTEYENIVVTYQGHFDKLCKGCFHQEERNRKMIEKQLEKEEVKENERNS